MGVQGGKDGRARRIALPAVRLFAEETLGEGDSADAPFAVDSWMECPVLVRPFDTPRIKSGATQGEGE